MIAKTSLTRAELLKVIEILRAEYKYSRCTRDYDRTNALQLELQTAVDDYNAGNWSY